MNISESCLYVFVVIGFESIGCVIFFLSISASVFAGFHEAGDTFCVVLSHHFAWSHSNLCIICDAARLIHVNSFFEMHYENEKCIRNCLWFMYIPNKRRNDFLDWMKERKKNVDTIEWEFWNFHRFIEHYRASYDENTQQRPSIPFCSVSGSNR